MTASRLFSTAILIACATAAWADTIVMKDGRVFAGTYLGGTARQIRVDLGSEVRTLDVSGVARIEFSRTAPAAEQSSDPDRPILRRAPDAAQPSDPSQPVAPPDDSDRPILRRAPDAGQSTAAQSTGQTADTGQAAQPAGPIQLAAGTNLVIRLIDPVDSQTATPGQSFAASMDQPVVVNGQTVIPRGANAVMRLVDTTPSGTFTGRTELALALISVKVNDQYVPINTQTVTRVSDARGEQTAKVVGGAAAVGAIIGAIAGGGKGAAIGAGAGGAAGAGAQVITKGQKVKIPSETRLTFTLEKPVSI
jgi:hypothetical protein